MDKSIHGDYCYFVGAQRSGERAVTLFITPWYIISMARTSSQDVPDELKPLFRKSIEQRDRYILGVAQGAKRLLSDRAKRRLRRTANINSPQKGQGSMFKFFAPMWRALTTEQKLVWKNAAQHSGISGWQLFISDNAARAKASLTFGIPPSELWQVRAGVIEIQSPADRILLKQTHWRDYVVTRKIRGMPWKEELVNVNENFGLPLEIQIRAKGELTAVGGTQRCRYYAEVWTSYQGQDIMHTVECNISHDADWTLYTATLSQARGIIIGYTLYLEIFGYTGKMLYDNVRAYHSGQNWARDPRCDNISRQFQKGFSQVLPFWEPVDVPQNVSYASYYPPSLS